MSTGEPFIQIGSDGGLAPQPVMVHCRIHEHEDHGMMAQFKGIA